MSFAGSQQQLRLERPRNQRHNGFRTPNHHRCRSGAASPRVGPRFVLKSSTNIFSGYSAQEHAVLSSAITTHSPASSTPSLPLDITVETIVATLVVVLGLVLGSPELRPIRWDVWAGKIERQGKEGLTGEDEKNFRGNPFAILEARPGFVDIRRQRKEFSEWAKGQGEGK